MADLIDLPGLRKTARARTPENAAHLAGIRSDSLGKRVAAGKLSYHETVWGRRYTVQDVIQSGVRGFRL